MESQQQNNSKPAGRSAYLSLSDKKRAFVDAYFACKFNGTQAAIDAGYSKKTANEQAARLLANVSVQNAVEERRAEIEEQNKLKVADVLAELRLLGFSRISDIVTWEGNRISIKNSDEISEDAMRCISEISETPTKHGTKIKIKLHPKTHALELLGKYLKMFVERHQVENDGFMLVWNEQK